jgi:4-hydroxy-tetrahydrodipicolinate reductase
MANQALRIAVLGTGRMGQQLVQVIEDASDCEVAGAWSRSTDTDLAVLLADADVAIDFTLPEGTREILSAMVDRQTPLVCGVTGLDAATEDAMAVAARSIPILYGRNMSRGIGVMSKLIRDAVRALGGEFRVEIRETHHIHKKDAPSGTAIALREALGDDSIDIESRREGEVLGDHRVRFVSASETMEIAHSVSDRRVFAEGALAAARWLADKPPGLYDMAEILSGVPGRA